MTNYLTDREFVLDKSYNRRVFHGNKNHHTNLIINKNEILVYKNASINLVN